MLDINSITVILIVLLLYQPPCEVETAKILAISGLPQPAKYAVMTSLLNALDERDHEITLIIRIANQAQLHNNIRQILIKENEEMYKGKFLLILYKNIY